MKRRYFAKFYFGFTDSHRIVLLQGVSRLRDIVNENTIHAADKLTVLVIAVDQNEVVSYRTNVGMLSRDAAVVQDDIVFFGAADGIGAARFEADLPTVAAWLSYFNDCAHDLL